MNKFSQSIDPALRNHARMKDGPYENMSRIFAGKITAMHPDRGTVDIALNGAISQGGFYTEVPISSWSYGTQTGSTYMPTIKLAAPMATKVGTYDQPIPSGEEDVWAIVGHLNNSAQRPVVLGFMSPYGAQTHVNAIGMELHVHETGVWHALYNDSSTTPNDREEWHGPEGSQRIVGIDASKTWTMTNYNKKWAPRTISGTTYPYSVAELWQGTMSITANNNLGKSNAITVSAPNGGNMTIAVADGNFVVTASGNVNISAAIANIDAGTVNLAGGGSAVARVGDSVAGTTSDGDTFSGTITSGSGKTFSG